jgi:hypothetical protein
MVREERGSLISVQGELNTYLEIIAYYVMAVVL